MRRFMPSSRPVVAVVVTAVMLVACSGSSRLPGAVGSVRDDQPAPTTTVSPSFPTCSDDEKALDPTRSYAPTETLPAPGAMPAGSTMAAIQQRGRLIVGVSGDTLLFGSRNPLNGKIEGFDIDMLVEVAIAIFGGDRTTIGEHLEFVAIPYGQRLPKLISNEVDIVAHTMTIN